MHKTLHIIPTASARKIRRDAALHALGFESKKRLSRGAARAVREKIAELRRNNTGYNFLRKPPKEETIGGLQSLRKASTSSRWAEETQPRQKVFGGGEDKQKIAREIEFKLKKKQWQLEDEPDWILNTQFMAILYDNVGIRFRKAADASDFDKLSNLKKFQRRLCLPFSRPEKEKVIGVLMEAERIDLEQPKSSKAEPSSPKFTIY